MHTHCLPISRCAHHPAEELPKFFAKKGIDAIVLTNHCYPAHCEPLSPDLNEQAKKYIETFYRCKTAGEQIGFQVFFGAEIKLIHEKNNPEFLLYGFSERDFIESYPLYHSTQKELFDFCNQKNIIMVQAHPYRMEQGYAPADLRYIHGIEILNSHPLFQNRFEQALMLADQNSLLKTAGSDFHIQDQAGNAGMIVPNDIENQFMLRDYLRKKETIIFHEKETMHC